MLNTCLVEIFEIKNSLLMFRRQALLWLVRRQLVLRQHGEVVAGEEYVALRLGRLDHELHLGVERSGQTVVSWLAWH